MNENHETKRNPFILHRIENEKRKWGNEKKKKKKWREMFNAIKKRGLEYYKSFLLFHEIR